MNDSAQLTDHSREKKKLVLVGAGHANLEIIKLLTLKDTKTTDIVLVSDVKKATYSGLIPAYIMDQVSLENLQIDLEKLCQRKSVKLILDSYLNHDVQNKILKLKSGFELKYDQVCFNTGALAKKLSSDSQEKIIYLKPFDLFLQNWNETQRICSKCFNPTFIVLGGGAAAVEVAAALKTRLNNQKALKAKVYIIASQNRLCTNYSQEISEKILNELQILGIQVIFNMKVETADGSEVIFSDGNKIKFDKLFVATSIFREKSNCFPIDQNLLVGEDFYAAGDCSYLKVENLWPPSGVVAVRQGRYLFKKLFRNENETKQFRLPRNTLNILTLGENNAIAIWGSHYFSGKMAISLKKYIDRQYMNSFK